MAKFVIFSKTIRSVEITEPITTLGRDKDNNIVITDPMLSRKHCLIEKDGNRLKIVDLKSANGTYVNGVRVKSRSLQVEDRIKIGDTVIFYSE
ncbi:MAG: FHA domain-containing protein [Planctomycetota bacterium]|nr:MAG: FHA domain-containing protein [Planctomycetota bacterium]